MGLIGAGIGAAGAIFGGIKASQAMKQVGQTIDRQQRENQDWYNRRYNEDATQRADAQRVQYLFFCTCHIVTDLTPYPCFCHT